MEMQIKLLLFWWGNSCKSNYTVCTDYNVTPNINHFSTINRTTEGTAGCSSTPPEFPKEPRVMKTGAIWIGIHHTAGM